MGVEVGVLSADPDRTKRTYPGVKCFDVSRGRLKAAVSAVRWSDIVIVGGGELVQDVSSLFYSPYNLLPLFLSSVFRKKSFAWAVGIGQKSELALLTPLMTRLALRKCSGITVRDRGSFNSLHRLGFREPEMLLTADCALTLPAGSREEKPSNILGAAPRDVSNRAGKLLPLELRKKMGIHRNADPLPAACAWASILDRQADKHGSEIILFPFHTGSLSNSDDVFCELIKSRMKCKKSVSIADPSDPEGFTSLIAKCRVLVTTPLHGAILAFASGTVPVAVSYSSKCIRFMEQALLMEYIVPGCRGIPGDTAVPVIEKAWINAEILQMRMTPVREKLVKRAVGTAEHFRKTFKL